MKLDEIDKKILKLLQEDSKQTTKELALKIDMSVTAVYERIKRLEKQGVINKYVALVNNKAVDKGFVVLCHIKLVQHTKEYLTTFEAEVVKLDEVLECYHVSGDYDYILKLYLKDIDAYREFMVTKLTTISHIGSTHSMFVINDVKHTTAITI
ncbi:Lrp/AsnC family transcriptional regulator [Mangrovimonas aestuarii]|uniref:Lrp/AsnC family transcriptional regulator n=1 Tax=Mangrovimonas aestuarii TaxID=3018443 RepID=UPI00237895E3|nr:Lrp/AsnC family transcriptional regulator [Mangrovimonas aestuarii]